jgi:HPt (histidine-containing phosphotransfer) domain-containing protein
MFSQSNTEVSAAGAASFERPIDLVHLARQTLGDRSLEQEILALYHKQAQSLLNSIEATASLRERADYAHTLKGSSRAVGAWHVANAAEALEVASPAVPVDAERAVAALRACVKAACDTIADLRRTH